LTKLFDPRAEIVTAWSLDSQIQCDLCDKQQPMLLHCCPKSETWFLKKMWKVFDRPDWNGWWAWYRPWAIWPPLAYNTAFSSISTESLSFRQN